MSNFKPGLYLFVIGLLFYLMGCTQNPSENPFPIATEYKLTNFEILAENNPHISSDLVGFIDSNNKIIRFRNPHLNATNLIASFEVTENADLFINNTIQESSLTINNFKNPLEYTLITETGEKSVWRVEMTREIIDLKEFLSICPTEDPNIGLILSDFNILLNGQLVTEFPCQEPYYIMNSPTSQALNNEYYTETTRLQSLRFLFYLDYDNPVKLPWSDLRLYDWLKDGMGGIKIVDGITGGSCCGWIDGEFYITVGNIRTGGENYIKSSNELLRGFTLMSIGLTLHERRHMDGFHHTSGCCENGSVCDLQLDLENPSAYGIMVWWNKTIWDKTYDFGQACAYNKNQFWATNSKQSLNPNRWSNYFCSGFYSYSFPQTQPECTYD